jgi:hypothetical protein
MALAPPRLPLTAIIAGHVGERSAGAAAVIGDASAATARLAASAQSAASTARPSAFVKPGGSKVGIF